MPDLSAAARAFMNGLSGCVRRLCGPVPPPPGTFTPLNAGRYVSLRGTAGFEEVGPGGYPRTFITLARPITVDGPEGRVRSARVYVGKTLQPGAVVNLTGRLDIDPSAESGRDGPKVIALSGVTNQSAGEPRYTDRGFQNASGAKLPIASVPYPRFLADAPGQRLVVDLGADAASSKIFVSSHGGFIPPWINSFHGLTAAKWREPTPAERTRDLGALEDLDLRFSPSRPADDRLLMDRPDHNSAIVYWVSADGNIKGVSDLTGMVHVDARIGLTAQTRRNIAAAFGNLRDTGTLTFGSEQPPRQSYERFVLEAGGTADSFTYAAMVPAEPTGLGDTPNPNDAREFYVERSGGLAQPTHWAGPIRMGGVDDATKARIDAWIAQNDLNEFGDPKDTMYLGGTPLFDERTGERIDRYEYILARHPWLATEPQSED